MAVAKPAAPQAVAVLQPRAVVVAAPPAPASKRGHRLAEDWQPSADSRAFARSLGLDPDDILAEFLDYWIALPGAKALKLDWQRTYRQSCRMQAKRTGRGRPGESRDDRVRRELNIGTPYLDRMRAVQDDDEQPSALLRCIRGA